MNAESLRAENGLRLYINVRSINKVLQNHPWEPSDVHALARRSPLPETMRM